MYQAESALTTAEKAIDALGAKMKTVRASRDRRLPSRSFAAASPSIPSHPLRPSHLHPSPLHPPPRPPPPPSLLHQCDDAIAAAPASRLDARRATSAARVDVERRKTSPAARAPRPARAVVDDRLAAERRFALRVASLEAEAKRADAIVEAKTREKETSAAEEVRARLAMDAARAERPRASRRRRVPAPRPGRRARSAAPMRPDGLASGVFEVRERGQTLEERG